MAVASRSSVKLVVLGDPGTGKTSLLVTYCTGAFPHEYIPTICDDIKSSKEFKGHPLNYILVDTTSNQDYAGQHTLSYPNTDAFLLCFSCANPSSFDNILRKWRPELDELAPEVPVILVGTKIDLRDNSDAAARLKDKNQSPISQVQGEDMKERVKAALYHEVSSLTTVGIEELFDAAFEVVLEQAPSKAASKESCKLM